jgi:putative acetyltransferase
MQELEISPADAGDVVDIAEMWHAGWHDGHAEIVSPALVATRTPAEFKARVEAHLHHTYVARLGGVLAGFYMLEGDEVYQFYVGGAFRGQGVAARLMADVEIALGGRVAWLACSVGNDRAGRFYEKAGWTREGVEKYTVETASDPIDVAIWRFEKDLR